MIKRNLRIAIYSGNIPSTTFIENLIEGLSQAGFEIYLFGKKTKNINYKGRVRIFSTPVSEFSLIVFVFKESLRLLFTNPRLLWRTLKKIWVKKKNLSAFFKAAGALLPIMNHPPDIFHIQWAKTVEQFPELFELLKCKFVLSLRGAHINYSPLTDLKLAESYRKYFPIINGFHAVSEAIGTESLKYGASGDKIKVIHSSIKNDLLKNTSKPFLSGETLQLISIGRYHWKKGYHYALDAMKILKDKGIKFHYSIIAQDNISEEILFMLEDYDLKEEVKILNDLSYDQIIIKLRNSHILLLPSVEEGIANVVLEAMGIGVTVISTDCGGMKEVINDKVNGYLVPVRSPKDIVLKILDFMDTNDESKKEMMESGKKKITEDFSREKQVMDFSDFYYSLVST